jgi:hypothetical protein
LGIEGEDVGVSTDVLAKAMNEEEDGLRVLGSINTAVKLEIFWTREVLFSVVA